MEIIKISQLTGKQHTLDIDITEEQLYQVENRRMLDLRIQDIVPYLPADQREFLITGITGLEWDQMYGVQDEYNDEKNVDENAR